jgi:hypothetical protein
LCFIINPATLPQRFTVSDKPERSWQEIATEAYQERDPERRRMLSEELERCLEERAKRIPPQNAPESKKQSA